jgi:hypothetical protein
MMAPGRRAMIQIAVIVQSGEWKIRRDGDVVGSGVTRSAAIELATALAKLASEEGHQVELLIQELAGGLTQRYLGD